MSHLGKGRVIRIHESRPGHHDSTGERPDHNSQATPQHRDVKQEAGEVVPGLKQNPDGGHRSHETVAKEEDDPHVFGIGEEGRNVAPIRVDLRRESDGNQEGGNKNQGGDPNRHFRSAVHDSQKNGKNHEDPTGHRYSRTLGRLDA